jgi:hypothetical protein
LAKSSSGQELSQAFAEISHLRNAWIFLNCLGICRKWNLFDNAQVLENGKISVKNYFKTNLDKSISDKGGYA